jgi:hypothetical protein
MKLSDLKSSLRKLARSNSGSRKSGLKPPKFAADLYADLRDRRLLPLVAVLAIAIVAVPVLLASGGGEESKSTPSFVQPGGQASASFSVVPAATSLRDYHRRLGHRQARDPFAHPSEGSSTASGGASNQDEKASGPGETSGGGEGGGTESSSSSSTTATAHVVVENQVVGYTVDLNSGFVGHEKDLKGVETMTKLPNDKRPVVVFVGLSEDNKRGLFLMTSNVTAFYGKGRCALEKQSCQLLELKVGGSATFAYGYEEERFKVTLQRIVPVVKTTESASGTVTKTIP